MTVAAHCCESFIGLLPAAAQCWRCGARDRLKLDGKRFTCVDDHLPAWAQGSYGLEVAFRQEQG